MAAAGSGVPVRTHKQRSVPEDTGTNPNVTALLVTVIATLRNESAAITPFLNALANQSRLPEEVILVDGGSSDDTLARIETGCPASLTVRVVVLPNANRSSGRNAAVKLATTPLIACTDVGSIAEPDWLAALVRPLEEDEATDVVAGFYRPSAPATLLQDAMAALVCPLPQDIDPTRWLPSARSMAFRRAAWEMVGGFPEEYEYGEDTVYGLRLRRAKFKFA